MAGRDAERDCRHCPWLYLERAAWRCRLLGRVVSREWEGRIVPPRECGETNEVRQ